MDMNSYVTGLVEGEGCFCISFNLRTKLNTNIEVRPSFSISQNQKNLELIKLIKNFFGCGAIRYSKHDRCYKYEIRNLDNLMKTVNIHFQNYPLIGSKKHDFENFTLICKMMKSNLHKNKDQLEKIIDLAYQINCGKRKYQKSFLLKKIAK